MKVKEFIKIFENTNIYCWSNVYSGNNIVGKENIKFDLSSMGWGCYAETHNNTFIFEKNGNIFKSYSHLDDVKNDKNIMEMELISILEFKIERYFNKSSSGNLYANNSSSIRFVVK